MAYVYMYTCLFTLVYIFIKQNSEKKQLCPGNSAKFAEILWSTLMYVWIELYRRTMYHT